MHCYWSTGPAKHSVHYGPARHTSGFPWISVSCSLSLKAGLAYTPGKDNTEGANWLQLVPHQTQVQRTAGIETLGLAAGVGSIRVSPCALTPWLSHSPWMEAYRSPDLPLFSLVTEKISISCSLALELLAIWCLRISSLGTDWCGDTYASDFWGLIPRRTLEWWKKRQGKKLGKAVDSAKVSPQPDPQGALESDGMSCSFLKQGV